ncbi:hypothetical protein B296_00007816, partial [Ensete ventricosum]
LFVGSKKVAKDRCGVFFVSILCFQVTKDRCEVFFVSILVMCLFPSGEGSMCSFLRFDSIRFLSVSVSCDLVTTSSLFVGVQESGEGSTWGFLH